MKQLLHFIGLDRAIAYTLLGRGWGVLSGFITLGLISRFLDPVEQGFYYTFSSVLALQVIFELGMGYVVMQFASHEMAQLTWTAGGFVEGEKKAKSRLRSLFALVSKWYGAVSLLILIGILPAGWVFFTVSNHNMDVSWRVAWVWIVTVAAVNVFVTPVYAIIEGCGRVADIARMRILQGVAGSVSAWMVLALGGHLLATPIMSTATLTVALIWLWKKYRKFFIELFLAHLPDERISWRTEIWPLQWRVALSWLSGYCIFQLFVPTLFAWRGAIEAGQMGMSTGVISALASVAMAWVNTKGPQFGNLTAMKRYQELDRLFFRTLIQSTLILTLGAAVLLLGVVWLQNDGNPLHTRILPIFPFSLLLLTTVLNHIVFAEAAYLRSHKQEPFMWLSIAVGLSVGLIVLIFGRQYGATGMMIGYLGVSLVISFGGGTWIFIVKRREWHSA